MQIDALICQGLRDASGLNERKQQAAEEGNLCLQNRALVTKGFNLRDYLGVEPYWGTLNCYVGTQAVDPLTYSREAHENRTMTESDRQMDPDTTN